MPDSSAPSIELRLSHLEKMISEAKGEAPLQTSAFLLALVTGTGGAYCAFIGLGLPNHPYQGVGGAVLIFFAYQRHWFRYPQKPIFWSLAAINLFTAGTLAKLFIGSGRQFPFQWLRYPELTWNRVGVLPTPTMVWQGLSFANQEVDLTSVQTFLIGLLIFGRCLRLPGFTSLMALLLLIASLPALISFHWNWVFPAMVLSGFGFYLQSREFRFPELSSP